MTFLSMLVACGAPPQSAADCAVETVHVLRDTPDDPTERDCTYTYDGPDGALSTLDCDGVTTWTYRYDFTYPAEDVVRRTSPGGALAAWAQYRFVTTESGGEIRSYGGEGEDGAYPWTTVYRYDAAGWWTGTDHDADADGVVDEATVATNGFDAAGRLASRHLDHTEDGWSTGADETYTYDAAGRLAQVDRVDYDGYPKVDVYTYNEDGTLRSMDRAPVDPPSDGAASSLIPETYTYTWNCDGGVASSLPDLL